MNIEKMTEALQQIILEALTEWTESGQESMRTNRR